MWSWGANGDGQLGLGSFGNKISPGRVGTGTTWAGFSAGEEFTVALKTDGTLWTSGHDDAGQLGDGASYDRQSFVRIGAGTTWAAVSSGNAHTLALMSDNTLWAWGRNLYGEMGNGNTGSNNYAPGQIGSGTTWSAVSTGSYHSHALKSDGTLWAWGLNNFGQLGIGSTIDCNGPVQVGTGTDWAAVSGGGGGGWVGWGSHTVALKSDNTLWTWGSNVWGQLGDPTITDCTVLPVQIGTGTTWIAASAGTWHTMALKSDGTLWGWGRGGYGQLGNGTYTDCTVPVQVGTGTTWSAVSAALEHTVALKSDGTLWAWGLNNYGELGNGTKTASNAPVQVGTGTDWAAVSSRYFFTVGRKTDGSLWAWGNNGTGQHGDGTAFFETPQRVY